MQLENIQVEYRKRKTFLIKVLPCTTVKVIAPRKANLLIIQELIRRRADWIDKKRKFYASCEYLNRKYAYQNGEEFLHLGRKYALELILSKREYAEVDGPILKVYSKHPENPTKSAMLIEKWYKEEAAKVFEERISEHSLTIAPFHRKSIVLKQRNMKQQWGSCSTSGKITLNTQLIKTPLECIDFVIMHELCHLVVMNHSKRFYAVMNSMMPDWKIRQAKLKMYTCYY